MPGPCMGVASGVYDVVGGMPSPCVGRGDGVYNVVGMIYVTPSPCMGATGRIG